jgi:hypothetical protein
MKSSWVSEVGVRAFAEFGVVSTVGRAKISRHSGKTEDLTSAFGE